MTQDEHQPSRRFVQSEWQRRCEEFMRHAGQAVRSRPDDPTAAERLRVARLVLEGALETVAGFGVRVVLDRDANGSDPDERFGLSDCDVELVPDGAFDMVGAVDGCLDGIVVNLCGLSTVGAGDAHLMTAVQDANQQKQSGPVRSDGKQLKPAGWQPPDIAGELIRQGWRPAGVKPAG